MCLDCFCFLTTLSREKVRQLEYGRFQTFQLILSGKALIAKRKAHTEIENLTLQILKDDNNISSAAANVHMNRFNR